MLRVTSITGMSQLMAATSQISAALQSEVTVVVGTSLVDPPYPYFLEYGTSRMAARPSARPRS